LENTRCGNWTYDWYGQQPQNSDGYIPFSDISGNADIVKHVCSRKCAGGCIGHDCFCDHYDHETMYISEADSDSDHVQPFCADAKLCRDLCHLHYEGSSCQSFDYDVKRNLCWLSSVEFDNRDTGCSAQALADNLNSIAGPQYEEGIEYWALIAGQATCSSMDMGTSVGQMTVTKRPHVDGNWVLTPGEDASIEITGDNLDWKTDRIIIIDSAGTCGISGPSESVSIPAKSQMQYNHWAPERFSDFEDHSFTGWMRGEVPYYPPGPLPKEPTFIEIAGKYCAGNNMKVNHITAHNANRHQCYKKCKAEAPCVGNDCHCSGLLEDYDTPDSDALCLDKDACIGLCKGLEDCFGVEMHADIDRCFLNGYNPNPEDEGSCRDYMIADTLNSDLKYSWIYKRVGDNTRRLLPAIDKGESRLDILRFKGLRIDTGGQFKVCFCDKETLGANEFCKKATDYKVDAGTIHVSGVSCLIHEPKFQRGVCVEQFYGGLRCYDSEAPVLDIPLAPEGMDWQVDSNNPAPDLDVSTFCLYGPEEETRVSPLCSGVLNGQ